MQERCSKFVKYVHRQRVNIILCVLCVHSKDWKKKKKKEWKGDSLHIRISLTIKIMKKWSRLPSLYLPSRDSNFSALLSSHPWKSSAVADPGCQDFLPVPSVICKLCYSWAQGLTHWIRNEWRKWLWVVLEGGIAWRWRIAGESGSDVFCY